MSKGRTATTFAAGVAALVIGRDPVMRRLRAGLLLAGLTSSFIVLPTVTVPAAAARPVAPRIQAVPVSGVDAGALAESKAPEPEEIPGSKAAEPELAPLVVTRKARTASFSALGVTWAADSAITEVAVQVRTRSGGRWSDWTEVEVQPNAGPDAATTESNTARDGLGARSGVSVRGAVPSVRGAGPRRPR